MSDLTLTTISMPTAGLGPENPFPPLFSEQDGHAEAELSDAPPEMLRNIGYGRLRSVLPYLDQDGYGRTRSPRQHPVAVLENKVLRATFLLGAGGRLWSLVHKPSGEELLFRNPIFQPANLALRNAWFAGGVEWNIGTIGHSPTTCSSLHAARVQRPDGTPVLRMYEFERLRRVVFQIDAYLPDGSEALLVHVRVLNPNGLETPMYWWSNIAVPETPDVRVIAPADHAFQFSYDRVLRRVPVPRIGSQDVSYPARARSAADYFFDIPADQRPWIAALGSAGTGLAQTSTGRLRGRKLFHWGRHSGGRRWQEWLSGPEQAYLEIQAGLATTQLEHVAMPARSSWSWLEAYGRVAVDAGVLHGQNWDETRKAASHGVDALITAERLDAELVAARGWVDEPPAETLHVGSGWGALERRRRCAEGDDSLILAATPFPDSTLGAEQEPWVELLTTGQMSPSDPNTAPVSCEIDPGWEVLLRGASGWLAAHHRGLAAAARGDDDAARAEWLRSVRSCPNAWSYRNLGALAAHDGDLAAATRWYTHAHQLLPRSLPLVREFVEVLIRAGQPSLALTTIGTLPADLRSDGRVQLLEACAALGADDLERCAALIERGIEVAAIREGETTLSDLWHGYHQRLAERAGDPETPTPPIPPALDFLMQPKPPAC